MIEFKEKQVEKIKNAKDIKSVELIINESINEMKKCGMESYRIKKFIGRLDISLLMLERRELTDKQWDNIKLAQKILVHKIVHGIRQDVVKSK